MKMVLYPIKKLSPYAYPKFPTKILKKGDYFGSLLMPTKVNQDIIWKPLKQAFFSIHPSCTPFSLSFAFQKGLLASMFRARLTPNPANRGTIRRIPKTLVPRFGEFVPHRYPEWIIGARTGPGWDRENDGQMIPGNPVPGLFFREEGVPDTAWTGGPKQGFLSR